MNLAEMLAKADSETADVEISSGEFELLKPGVYDAVIVKAEGPLPTKGANPLNPSEFGQKIEIEFSVTGPTDAGRKLWHNNNILVYPKAMDADSQRRAQTAMAIGAAERRVWLESLGKTSISDAPELNGATCRLKVVIGKKQNGDDRNEIKKILPSSASSGSSAHSAPSRPSRPSPAAAPVQAPAPAATNGKMPWEV